jgi:hypothetical protein
MGEDMIEPSLAVQIAIRSALIASPAVTGLVPATSIFDRRTRPELFPCIIIGDGQTALEPITLARSHVRVFADLHIWTKEGGLETVKTIAGNASAALRAKPSIDGFHVVDWKVTGTRFLRDPADEYGHAITSIEALVMELVA